MPKKLTSEQRNDVLRMLAAGEDRETIAAALDITAGQVSAISAHVKMGTYSLPAPEETELTTTSKATGGRERAGNLLKQLRNLEGTPAKASHFDPILLGPDAETGETIHWNPDPNSGAANPHVLVLGESGFGKTYTISCLLAELAQQGITSVIFDYGQGFSLGNSPAEFIEATAPLEMLASRDGIDINPLQIFPTDLHGPVNVAQRVADTFARVYPRIGVQQHAVLRQAVLEVMADEGIVPETPDSWERDLPTFANVQPELTSYANQP